MVVRGRPLRIRERGRFCYLCDIYLSGDLCWTHGRLHGLDYGRWRGLGGTLIRSGTNGNSIRCSVRCRRRFRLVFIRFAHFLFIQESYCKTKQKENNKTKKKLRLSMSFGNKTVGCRTESNNGRVGPKAPHIATGRKME